MEYFVKEEIANTVSHAAGVVFGLVFLPLLFPEGQALKSNFLILLSASLYSFGFLFIFLSSTIYHGIVNEGLKKQMQRVDHIAIYFMIAGSYTPFIFECLAPARSWIFFSIMWAFVLFGSIFKLFFTGKYDRISLFLYLAMGWMVVFIAKPFLGHFDDLVITFVALGGLSYTVGTYFYANDQRPYYHFVWHLFVLAGAILHFFAIACFL